MIFRLALQPLWVRLLVSAPLLAVLWAAGMNFASSRPPTGGIWSTVIYALIGVTFATFTAYQREPVHQALVETVAGVDKTKRCQAIAAITHGVVPADPTVRSVAIQLGAAYLDGRSAATLKRQERQTWTVVALVAAGSTLGAVLESSVHARLCFLALALLAAVVLPLGLLRTRRIQRNGALLTEGLPRAAFDHPRGGHMMRPPGMT